MKRIGLILLAGLFFLFGGCKQKEVRDDFHDDYLKTDEICEEVLNGIVEEPVKEDSRLTELEAYEILVEILNQQISSYVRNMMLLGVNYTFYGINSIKVVDDFVVVDCKLVSSVVGPGVITRRNVTADISFTLGVKLNNYIEVLYALQGALEGGKLSFTLSNVA